MFITVINFMYHDYVVGSPGFPRHQLMERRRLATEGYRAKGLGRRVGAGGGPVLPVLPVLPVRVSLLVLPGRVSLLALQCSHGVGTCACILGCT